jgi:hypothetical protein
MRKPYLDAAAARVGGIAVIITPHVTAVLSDCGGIALHCETISSGRIFDKPTIRK